MVQSPTTTHHDHQAQRKLHLLLVINASNALALFPGGIGSFATLLQPGSEAAIAKAMDLLDVPQTCFLIAIHTEPCWGHVVGLNLLWAWFAVANKLLVAIGTVLVEKIALLVSIGWQSFSAIRFIVFLVFCLSAWRHLQ